LSYYDGAKFFDIQKLIEIAVWQGSNQVWYDAKVISVCVDIVEDDNEYRPALNLICEYYTSDDVYGTQLFDVLANTSDNWRYKENLSQDKKGMKPRAMDSKDNASLYIQVVDTLTTDKLLADKKVIEDNLNTIYGQYVLDAINKVLDNRKV
jgi:hypothetical protein